ncbi:MAG: hypothetical protein AB1646_24940 [Thermodesulfobacteriota bacterium]
MRRILVVSIAVGLCHLLPAASSLAEDPLGMHADVLNSYKIQEPERPGDKTYLGLTASGPFSVGQVKAEVLIVQIFSMYCPHCQADAPNVLSLCGLIDKDPKLKGRVKLLGLGLNNTWYEVDFFRNKYKMPFPMIPDEQGTFQSAAKETIRTPAYVVLKLSPGKPAEVAFTKLRAIKGVEEFLDQIRKLLASKG